MKKLSPLILGSLLCGLAACSCPTPKDYASNTPKLDLRDYVDGEVDGWGMFINHSGKADPMFSAALHGDWNGNDGTVKEHFVYNTGKTQDRQWTVHYSDEHHFTATAPDVIGVATGMQYGNAVELRYVITITSDNGSKHDVTSDDWLYQMDDHTLINRNTLSKLGFKVGELVIEFQKE